MNKLSSKSSSNQINRAVDDWYMQQYQQILSTFEDSSSNGSVVVNDGEQQSSTRTKRIATASPNFASQYTVSVPGALRLNKFVRRLHDMLVEEKHRGVVEWRKGLLVLHSTDKFAKEILPKYFNTKNFKTFRRQLNYYGFVHVRSFSTTGQTTTALWVNQDLAKRGSNSISSVLLLKRVDPCPEAKTAEGRRVRKEEAAHTVECDIGVDTRAIQMDQLRFLANSKTGNKAKKDHQEPATAAVEEQLNVFKSAAIERNVSSDFSVGYGTKEVAWDMNSSSHQQDHVVGSSASQWSTRSSGVTVSPQSSVDSKLTRSSSARKLSRSSSLNKLYTSGAHDVAKLLLKLSHSKPLTAGFVQ
uniref:HSF-type DNA-binding domain-containing protein n=1 Tax=Leptocylindrus danicus TaxID=163516 RepID=A0A7S2P136_9STRA